jgi:TPR repeat protein
LSHIIYEPDHKKEIMKKIVFCILLIFCFPFAKAQPSKEEVAKIQYSKAEEAYSNSEYLKCIEWLDRAEVSAGIVDPKIQYLRVKAYYNNGQKEKAYEGCSSYFKLPGVKKGTEKYKEILGIYVELEQIKEEDTRDADKLEEALKEYYAKNYSGALTIAKPLADKGVPRAMNLIGLLYHYGAGVAQDHDEAVNWYKKAANKGFILSMQNLGDLYYYGKKNYSEAAVWYKKAFENGNKNVANILGCLYLEGYGVTKNYSEAFKLYKIGIENGDTWSMFNTGLMYEKGLGVKQDYTLALDWYRKAAEKGNELAMRTIGNKYCNGQGVKEDFAIAYSWYQKAAEKGDVSAMNNLGNLLYFKRKGVNRDRDKAREWYKKAAEKGDAKAMYNLGVIEAGDDAIEWFKKSYNAGFKRAANCITIMSSRLMGAVIKNKYNKLYDEWINKIDNNFPSSHFSSVGCEILDIM